MPRKDKGNTDKDSHFSENSDRSNKQSKNVTPPQETVKFYYNREERLKKLHRTLESKKYIFFRNRKTKRLLILFLDIVLIAIVIYALNRPTNVYDKNQMDNMVFEMNITGMRGKRVMFAFSITNKGENTLDIYKYFPINVKILNSAGDSLTFTKNTVDPKKLKPGDTTSVVFMIKENFLPNKGRVVVYINGYKDAIFEKNVRFYYFKYD